VTSPRRPLVVGNWKMHRTVREAVVLVMELRNKAPPLLASVDLAVAPPFTALHPCAHMLQRSGILLAAQNCHHEASGAYTGEVAAAMLKEIGCTHVILGHSERRQQAGETSTLVARKARQAQASGLVPIVCVGETLAERDAGQTLKVVAAQVRESLHEVDATQVVLAYEPVWAIGTGRTATPEQAQEVHRLARLVAGEFIGDEAAKELKVLYGGSVKPDNAASLMAMPDVDGALVGGASLQSADFLAIAQAAAELRGVARPKGV
jgi:triosephosphate isomerase (TIM)